ncbi:MAG: TonB-dependent receptor [Acidobacteria bacterium]|nr:TonB-dependent receptor [Acidobacteriota bacterium]
MPSIAPPPPPQFYLPRTARLFQGLSVLLIQILFLHMVSGLAASIHGRVEGPRGLLAGAEVRLLQQQRQVQAVTSDSEGEFVFENLPAGDYQLEVVLAPYLPVVQEITVSSAPNERMELTIPLETLNETVTVTAARIPMPVGAVISDVKILTDEDLREMPYQALDDRLRAFPEFALFRRSSSLVTHPTTQGFSLRGIGASGVSRSLVLVDGVPMNDAFGGWVYWDRIPFLSIQQVELANGGGSSLYGNYALGGVLQLLKRIPEPATFEFQGQGGSRESLRGDLYGSHRIGPWGFSVAGSFFDFDGYPIVVESQRGAVDINAASRHQAARFYVERAPTASSWIWSLDGGFLNENRDNGTPVQQNDTFSYDFSTGVQGSISPRDRLEARAFFRRSIFASDFSAVAGDRNSERRVVQQHVPSVDGGASLLWYATRGRHRIVTGTDFWLVSGQSADTVFFGPRVGLIRLGGGKQATVGFFAEENYAISSRTALVLGGRVDLWKNFDGFRGSLAPDAPRLAPPVEGRTVAVFSPRAGLTYQINSRLNLYGSVYRSFRAPTLNELYRQFRVGNVTTFPNTELEPEHNTGGEVGVRFRASQNWSLGLAGFANLLTDPVSNVTQEILLNEDGTIQAITRQRQNLGRVRIHGLQATATWQPIPEVKLEGHYLWDRTRVTEFTEGSAVVGKQLPQVPQHRFSFHARFSLPRAVRLAVTGRFVGDQFDDDLNSLVLDRYFQMDAHLSHSLGDSARLFVSLENITDSKILVRRTPVDVIGTPFQIRGGVYFQFRRDGL